MHIIQSLVEDIRYCRMDRNIPCLLGAGFTISVKGSTCAIVPVDGGHNFSGKWNHCVRWDRAGAESVAAQIRAVGVALDIEVVHVNVLRDRSEEVWTRLVRHCWPTRWQMRSL